MRFTDDRSAQRQTCYQFHKQLYVHLQRQSPSWSLQNWRAATKHLSLKHDKFKSACNEGQGADELGASDSKRIIKETAEDRIPCKAHAFSVLPCHQDTSHTSHTPTPHYGSRWGSPRPAPWPANVRKRPEVRGHAGIMAALCGYHARAAGSRFLRALLFSKPFRNASTESGSESVVGDSSAPLARSGGFASALERLSELQRKAEHGPVSRPRGARPDAGSA